MSGKLSFTGARASWPSLQWVGWARLQVTSCVGPHGLARQGYRGASLVGLHGSKLGRATGGLAGQGYRGAS